MEGGCVGWVHADRGGGRGADWLGATSGGDSVSGISAAAAAGSGAVSLRFFVYRQLFALGRAALTAGLARRLHSVALGVAIVEGGTFRSRLWWQRGAMSCSMRAFC